MVVVISCDETENAPNPTDNDDDDYDIPMILQRFLTSLLLKMLVHISFHSYRYNWGIPLL